MKLKKVLKKEKVKDVRGQNDCFNDCVTITWSGNRNATDNKGRCSKRVNKNCQWTCDW